MLSDTVATLSTSSLPSRKESKGFVLYCIVAKTTVAVVAKIGYGIRVCRGSTWAVEAGPSAMLALNVLHSEEEGFRVKEKQTEIVNK